MFLRSDWSMTSKNDEIQIAGPRPINVCCRAKEYVKIYTTLISMKPHFPAFERYVLAMSCT